MIAPASSSRSAARGWPALSFINTMEWHAGNRPQETLNSFADLVAWARRTELLDERQAESVLRQYGRDPAGAAAVLAEARASREALYRIFVAVIRHQEPPPEDIAVFNRALDKTAGRSALAWSEEKFVRVWSDFGDPLVQALASVLLSAAELITSDELGRVGLCADEKGCGWLFFDTSRNRSRRWCDMRDCGNRAKARRHHKKKRVESRLT